MRLQDTSSVVTPVTLPCNHTASRPRQVFIAECLSARVSYYEMSIDGGRQFKQKSSGLCVSTGTGSTSWTYNINKLTPQVVGQVSCLADVIIVQ